MERKFSTKRMVLLALLVALSAVGAYIIIPSPIGTVAFDSAPGYFSCLLLGGSAGGFVLFLGHLVSALKIGFPLGMLHLLIAGLMAVCGVIYSYTYKKAGLVISTIVAIILNGVVVTALLIPFLGSAFFFAMVGPLLLGSAANILMSGILFKLINNRVNLQRNDLDAF